MSSIDGVFGHQVVTGLRAASAGLTRSRLAPVWQCADDEVEAAVELLDRIEAQTAALRAALLLQAEERSLQQRTGAPSTGRWLVERFRWSRSRAAAAIAQARTLAARPVVAAALADGALTSEQARAVSEALARIDRVPGVSVAEREDAAHFLVQHAAALGPGELAVVGRQLEETLTRLPSTDDPADAEALAREQDRAEREAQRRERNAFRLFRGRDGRCRATLDLGPVGEAVTREWAKGAERRAPGVDGFEDDRDLSERRGDALVDLLAREAAASAARPEAGNDPDAGSGDGPDLFGQGAPAPNAADTSARLGAVSPVALLSLAVTLSELRAGLTGAGMLEGGTTVSAATLRRLACDALVVPAVMGGPSEVLDLGRARRLHSPAQRRAIILRDRACIAPGCDRPPRDCHVHHDPPWDAGGTTDTEHGYLLCDYHHHRVHQQGWTIRLGTNGYPELIPPKSIDPQQRPRQHARFQLLNPPRRC